MINPILYIITDIIKAIINWNNKQNINFFILFNSFFMAIIVFIQGILNILKIKNDIRVGFENIDILLFIKIFMVVNTCSRAINPSIIDMDNTIFRFPKKG